MALNLNLGGSIQKTSGQQDTTQQQSQISKEQQTGSQITTNLDAGTIATLQQIIQTLSPTVGQSQDADMIRQLSGKLATNLDPAIVQANIDASQAAAIRNFQQNQGAQIAGLQQQIGSTGNSFAQIIQQQGNVDLSTMLAQIAAQFQLGAAGQRSADLSGAIAGFGAAGQAQSQPLQQLLAAVSTLSGARTQTDTNQQSFADTVSNLTQQVKSKGKTSSFGGSIGLGGS